MKSHHSLKRATNSRLNSVIRESERVNQIAKDLKKDFSPEVMQELRNWTESLTQCVHEYSAYHNALTTD